MTEDLRALEEKVCTFTSNAYMLLNDSGAQTCGMTITTLAATNRTLCMLSADLLAATTEHRRGRNIWFAASAANDYRKRYQWRALWR
jgi:hypothetical protein